VGITPGLVGYDVTLLFGVYQSLSRMCCLNHSWFGGLWCHIIVWCVPVFEQDVLPPTSGLEKMGTECLLVRVLLASAYHDGTVPALVCSFYFTLHKIMKCKPFPFKCSSVSTVTRLWAGWLESWSSVPGIQRFSRLLLVASYPSIQWVPTSLSSDVAKTRS
jgi:hypothetical protein